MFQCGLFIKADKMKIFYASNQYKKHFYGYRELASEQTIHFCYISMDSNK